MTKPTAAIAATLLLTLGLQGNAVARGRLAISAPSEPAVQTGVIPPPAAGPLFRQIIRSGVTKPAGAALAARLGTKPSLDAESRRLNHLIRTAVCTGC